VRAPSLFRDGTVRALRTSAMRGGAERVDGRAARGATTVIAMSRRPSPDDATAPRFDDALAHADALYNLARHLTRNAADAEDLVQETYARAVRSWDARDAGASLAAWLFRILRNAWLDRARRDRRSPVEDDPEGVAADAADGAPASEGWLRDDADLERMRGLVAEEIETALQSLTEDARTVVLLDVEGFTETEVAHVLGCAVGTVKSRLARARAALRARLADYAHAMGNRS
jgi:RNA polymerase sigma-70 factor (ECF subfamily)